MGGANARLKEGAMIDKVYNGVLLSLIEYQSVSAGNE